MTPEACVGPYRLLAPLGRGGMGEVFAAVHERTGQQVAIKLLSRAEPALAARLLQEARALSQIDHPGVVRVLFLGNTESGDPYLVLERVAGQSLRALLREHPEGIPIQRTLRLLSQVASALWAVHQCGIVHRDLKPDNILVVSTAQQTDRIKVIDFGVARVPAPPSGGVDTVIETKEDEARWIGTAAYMAPEQCRGQGAIGPAVDVYALGLLLCECLTGQPLFQASEPLELAALHLHGKPDLGFIRFTRLRRLVRNMLAKDPAVRPTMPEVADALTQLATVNESRRVVASGLLAAGGTGLLMALGFRTLPTHWLLPGRDLRKKSFPAIDAVRNGVLPGQMSPPGLIVLAQLEKLAVSDAELWSTLPSFYQQLPWVRLAVPPSGSADSQDFERAASSLVVWFENSLAPLFQQHPDYQLVYFGYAPLSLMIYLGWLVGAAVPVEVRLRHHEQRRFLPWTETESAVRCIPPVWSREPDEREGDVVVRLSTSHPINVAATRAVVADPLCEVDVQIDPIGEDVFRASADLTAVVKTWKRTLDEIIVRYPRVQRVHLFASVQAGLAFLLGTHVSPTMHPPITLYQYRAGANHLAFTMNERPLKRAGRG